MVSPMSFLKQILVLVLLLVACVTVDAGRPNVIVIVADYLCYADMSFLPQSPNDVNTPALDQLAKGREIALARRITKIGLRDCKRACANAHVANQCPRL